MPPAEEVQQYLLGAWRMMLGRVDGLDLLDISSDGFWNSFFAIVLATPVLVVGWVGYANECALPTDGLAWRIGIVARLALADLAAWLVPIACLAAVVGRTGLGDRFVHYVVASNWGSVITIWLMLPPSLMELVGAGGNEVVGPMYLVLMVVALVLGWRLTNAALQKGPGLATALFSAMLVAAIFSLYTMQSLLGVLPAVKG
ncbi:MAG: transporter [Rhizobiaceae bacterium]